MRVLDMRQFFQNLDRFGYRDCFYEEGQLWGFRTTDVMPIPVPEEISQAAEGDSPRDRLSQRLRGWCDRRGIYRHQSHSPE